MTVAKTRREGWLLIDNRDAPPHPRTRKFFEAATTTCNHCGRQVLRDPGAPVEKYWCSGCDSYLCKRCKTIAVVAGCKPFDKVIEEHSRRLNSALIL